MSVQTIQTKHAPAAIGPYAQGIVAGEFLFTAGQIPLDPSSGQLVEGDVGAQTERVLKNLGAIVEAAGASWTDVVKTTVYMRDLSDFPRMNEVYARAFGTAAPARSTVQVDGLPRGALIEIDAVVFVANGKRA